MDPAEFKTSRRLSGRLRSPEVAVSSPLLSGRMLNMSAHGMGIETHHPVQITREYEFDLQCEGARAKLCGKAVWCALKATTRLAGEVVPIYQAGFTLTRKTPGFDDILARMREVRRVRISQPMGRSGFKVRVRR